VSQREGIGDSAQSPIEICEDLGGRLKYRDQWTDLWKGNSPESGCRWNREPWRLEIIVIASRSRVGSPG
jgi:hypothetical protein